MDTPDFTADDQTAFTRLNALLHEALTGPRCTADLLNMSSDILGVYAFTPAVIPAPVAVAGSKVRIFATARLMRAVAPTVAEVDFTVSGELGGEPPVLMFSLYDANDEEIMPPALTGTVMSHALMHPALYDFWIERTAMFALLSETIILDVAETLADDLFCHEEAEHLIEIATNFHT